MSTEDFALAEIAQIAINVQDVERAGAFYRDVLGMKESFSAPGMAFLDCGGVRLMLSLASGEEFDHPASIIYYRVDAIQAAYEALSGRGVQFEREPHRVAEMPDHDLWMAFLRDPEGNLLALSSEEPKAGS